MSHNFVYTREDERARLARENAQLKRENAELTRKLQKIDVSYEDACKLNIDLANELLNHVSQNTMLKKELDHVKAMFNL